MLLIQTIETIGSITRVPELSLGTTLPAFWRARDIRLLKSDTLKTRL
jgi:hypothetical protein